MYLNRQLEKVILKANENFPVILLTGPRQVGKSTLLKYLADPGRTYLTFDDPVIRQAALDSPARFFQIHKPPLLIDEVQYVPDLFPYIKMIVDETNEPGLFWLTGSQLFQLMENVKESLAGRIALLNLYSLSQAEIQENFSWPFPPSEEELVARWESLELATWPSVDQRIFEGGMPRLLAHSGMDRQLFYSSYFQTYLQKDIRDITHIQDLDLFSRFVRLAATRTSQELNLSGMASAMGIDATTARRWFNALLLTGIVFTLPAWSVNLGKRLIKRPKLYFSDTGFCTYLCGFDSAAEAGDSLMRGPLFETYVVSEIMKSWVFSGKEPSLYYVRESGGRDIDLIIERGHKIYPFEIKRSQDPVRPFRNWSLLDEKASSIGYSGVISASDQLLPWGDQRWHIPWQMI